MTEPLIRVRFDDADAQRRVDQVALFMSDLRWFWPRVVPIVTGWWRKQFDTEGEFGGEPWAPLSPAYAARKQQLAPGKGILQFSGALKRAASRPLRFQSPTRLTLTIDDDVLSYHQEGTTRMPARPLIFGEPLPAEAQAELDLAAHESVTDLLHRLG